VTTSTALGKLDSANRLEVTKTYHDLYLFDSRKVKCLGVIKDLVITLFQLPMKSVVMYIVAVDVPPKFGILFSRYWIKRLGGDFADGPFICHHSYVWGRT
jgi:hypothetical protein